MRYQRLTAQGDNVVEMRSVTKTFGTTTVLKSIDLAVKANEVVALLGPSGCGKSTILKLLAGFFPPDDGMILLQNASVNGIPSHKRNLGMVFQDYSLFPHMNVFDNVGFGLAVRRRPQAEIRTRVREMLDLVDLSAMAERFPGQLSGGQKQRIAIARALAVNPPVLLCDEPLSNLDAKLRKDLLLQLKRLQRETGVAMVYVTHDQEEAVILADQIALLNAGSIEQTANAADTFERPRTRFGAEFMGYSNFIDVKVQRRCADGIEVFLPQGALLELPFSAKSVGDKVTLCIREERIGVAMGDPVVSPGEVRLTATIDELLYTGTSHVLVCDCGDGFTLKSRLSAGNALAGKLKVGDTVILILPSRDLRCLEGPIDAGATEHS